MIRRSYTGHERRRAPRLVTRLPFAITDGTGAFIGHTKNISLTGAYCTVPQFLAPMTKLQVELELPSRPRPVRVACKGIVVRAEGPMPSRRTQACHVAIVFSDMSEAAREAIGRYVRRRLRMTPARTGAH